MLVQHEASLQYLHGVGGRLEHLALCTRSTGDDIWWERRCSCRPETGGQECSEPLQSTFVCPAVTTSPLIDFPTQPQAQLARISHTLVELLLLLLMTAMKMMMMMTASNYTAPDLAFLDLQRSGDSARCLILAGQSTATNITKLMVYFTAQYNNEFRLSCQLQSDRIQILDL